MGVLDGKVALVTGASKGIPGGTETEVHADLLSESTWRRLRDNVLNHKFGWLQGLQK